MVSKKKTNAKPSETVEEESHTVTEEPETEIVTKEESIVSEPALEQSIASRIVSKFGTKTVIGFIKPNRIRINTKKEDILDVAAYIRDELNFDHAESVSGVDHPQSKEIEVVYHLGSYSDPQLAKQILTLSTRVPREDIPNPGKDSTKMPSLRDVFYSVEFHERECFEMLGVYFEGHPDNRSLLLPEDWADIPPLRKDFRIKGR
jgi:NADH-quinone oxidoreductase subunit C